MNLPIFEEDNLNEEIKPIIPCPVCGSKDIERISKNNGINGPGYCSWIIRECCNNCGVLLMHNRKERQI
jgi:hypothetical protein